MPLAVRGEPLNKRCPGRKCYVGAVRRSRAVPARNPTGLDPHPGVVRVVGSKPSSSLSIVPVALAGSRALRVASVIDYRRSWIRPGLAGASSYEEDDSEPRFVIEDERRKQSQRPRALALQWMGADHGAKLDSHVMPTEVVAGFWSYAHEDNKLDGGAILQLAHLIAEEYSLISGDQLELFVDHDSIAWGEEWRNRIDSALAQTTFFIPIITPRYFRRPECRRELLEFAAKAEGLGVIELLLPILYVEPQDFSAESPDEAVALTARTQYQDWRTARLVEFSSREYRASVNALARRLLEITRQVSEKQLDWELSADPEASEVDGVTDVLEEVTRLLPEWLDAVMGEKVNFRQLQATMRHCLSDIRKLERSRAPAGAVLAARIRTIREILPLLERGERDAKIYLARSVKLDPLISTLARLVADHPESYQLVTEVRQAIDEAVAGIRMTDDPPRSTSLGEILTEWRHLGRMFQKAFAISNNSSRQVREGNEIVLRWDTELRPQEL
jgi:hypothetical protein